MKSCFFISKSISMVCPVHVLYFLGVSCAQGGIRAESDTSLMLDHESHSVGCVADTVAIHAGSGERSFKRIDPRRTSPFPSSS
jgi:hypothetical protein